jgi:hypothetical protein
LIGDTFIPKPSDDAHKNPKRKSYGAGIHSLKRFKNPV